MPETLATNASGVIRARLIAGDAVGLQKVTIEADGFQITETVENFAVSGGLNAGTASLDMATSQSTTLTANFPNAANGTPVRWFASRGQLLDVATTVQNGHATATLRAGGGRIGPALVTASVGGTSYGTEVNFTSSSPFVIEVEHPVIVGDEAVNGTAQILRLDGTSQAVAYRTSTPLKLKAPAYAGQIATVQFGKINPNVFARLRMNEINGSITPDEVSGYHATVNGATLDTARKHEGGGSLRLDDTSATLTISDNVNLRLQDGFTVSLWVQPSSPGGTLIDKPGEYRLFIDDQGRAVFGITTTTGEQLIVGTQLCAGQWSQVTASYKAVGMAIVTVNGISTGLPVTSNAATGTAAITVGQSFKGWLDLLTFSRGDHFISGTDLSVTGLTGGQVLLDANGEATLGLASTGQGGVGGQNPVTSVAMRVSVNSEFEIEDVVQVTTRENCALLYAAVGDVKVGIDGPTAALSAARTDEIVAQNLKSYARTGQRSVALSFPPTGTLSERTSYGYRAALWLAVSIDGAQQVRLIMENTSHLSLPKEKKEPLCDAVQEMLMQSIQSGSDSGANSYLTEANSGLIDTLAGISNETSFSAFTAGMDGSATFAELAAVHDIGGASLVRDLATLTAEQSENPGFLSEILGILKTMEDISPSPWQQVVFSNLEEFLRKKAHQAFIEVSYMRNTGSLF